MLSKFDRISVVIAAYQAGDTLRECLAALERSSIRPYEVIVVDDASEDETAAMARERGCTVLSTGERSGPARARNLGAAKVRGDVLIFLDADVCVHADTIERLVSHLADPAIGAAFGAYDDNPSDRGFLSRYRNLLHCHTHRIGRADAATFWAGCGAIRRDVFEAFGGFDEQYEHASIEDVDLGLRLTSSGVRIRLDPHANAQHLKRWTFRRMLQADVFYRGIPWTRLIFERGRMPNDLNLRWSQRVSVAASWIAAAALCSRHMVAAETALASIAVCNWRFLKFLAGRAGLGFSIQAFPVQVLFSFYCGVSFVAGGALHLRANMTGTTPVQNKRARFAEELSAVSRRR